MYAPSAAMWIGIGVLLLGSSACHRGRTPDLPRYEVTYYDRNHDGAADLEFHHAPGYGDTDWGFIDTDFNASYDVLFGPGFSKPTKVMVPVPGHVPITKKLPTQLQNFR